MQLWFCCSKLLLANINFSGCVSQLRGGEMLVANLGTVKKIT